MNENSSKFSYTLVLPPWGPLYHWQTRSLGDQTKIPWKNFFDVESISRYVPCLDFEDYLKSKFPLYYFTLKEESKITDETDIDIFCSYILSMPQNLTKLPSLCWGRFHQIFVAFSENLNFNKALKNYSVPTMPLHCWGILKYNIIAMHCWLVLKIAFYNQL